MTIWAHVYRWLATGLWLLVGVSLGFMLAALFEVPDRVRVFLIVLFVGSIALLRYHSERYVTQAAVPVPQLESGEAAAVEETGTALATEPTRPASEEPTTPLAFEDALFAGKEMLSADEGRQWLDEFLVKQQKDSQADG